MRPTDEGELIGLISEAGLQPDLWRPALDRVTRLFGTGLATLLWRDGAAGSSAELNELSPVDRAEFRPYGEYYARVDLRWQYARRHPLGEVYTDFPGLTYADFQKTEIWTDFWRPRGAGRGAGIVLLRDAKRTATFFTCLAPGAEFSTRQLGALQRLSPHLSRALRVQRQIGLAQEAAGAARLMMDHMPTPALMTDRHARLLEMNNAAAAILCARDDILRLTTSGHLTLIHQQSRTKLLAAIAQAHLVRDGSPPPPIFIAPGPRGPLAVMVCAALGHPFRGAAPAGSALVFIADHAQRRLLDPVRLMQEFHFTMAEARTVAALATGSSVEQIAEACGIQNGTVYLHVKHALAKTGASTQAQLVALVLRGVAASVANPGKE